MPLLGGKQRRVLGRGPLPQAPVRPLGVVFLPPVFDRVLGLGQRRDTSRAGRISVPSRPVIRLPSAGRNLYSSSASNPTAAGRNGLTAPPAPRAAGTAGTRMSVSSMLVGRCRVPKP